MISHMKMFVIPWTVAHQTPLSIRLSRQKYWSRLPFPPPEDLPYLGIKPVSLASPALAGRLLTIASPGKKHIKKQRHKFADNSSYSQSYGFSSGHVWM